MRLREEETLSTYGYIDKNAGTVRIPIDRAMELLVATGTSGTSASRRLKIAAAAARQGKEVVKHRNQNSMSKMNHVGTDAFVRPVEQSSTAAACDLHSAAVTRPSQRPLRILSALCGKALAASLLLASAGWGQGMSKGIMSPPANVRPPYLTNVGIEQRLDAQVPADLSFTDDTGRAVKLGDYFDKKPLILNLVYYNCPMLCGEALAGLTGSMKMIKFDVGNEFEVLTVSFNPRETTQLAAEKKKDYLKRYGRA